MKQTIQPNIELIAEDEEFKTVVIYDETYPNYLISNYGRVYSLKANRIKYFSIDNKGYTRFILSKNGKIKAISGHRLVAFAFVVNPQPDEYNTVNHLDESTTFESMPKAAQACNTTQSTVHAGCKTGIPKKGFIFQYAS